MRLPEDLTRDVFAYLPVKFVLEIWRRVRSDDIAASLNVERAIGGKRFTLSSDHDRARVEYLGAMRALRSTRCVAHVNSARHRAVEMCVDADGVRAPPWLQIDHARFVDLRVLPGRVRLTCAAPDGAVAHNVDVYVAAPQAFAKSLMRQWFAQCALLHLGLLRCARE